MRFVSLLLSALSVRLSLLAVIPGVASAAFMLQSNPIHLPISGAKCSRRTFAVETRRNAKSSKATKKTKASAAVPEPQQAPITPPPTPAAVATAAPSFRKSDLIKQLAENHSSILKSKRDAELIADSILTTIMDEVKAGSKVSLSGFGSFSLQHRAARKGRNPQTGEELQLPACDTPKFTPAKAWKDYVNGK